MTVPFPVYARELGVRRQAGAAQRPNYTSRLLLVVVTLLVATQLRAAHLLENRFHQDEALYATFARFIASGPGHGLPLSHMLVDKPPLAFYLNGLSVAIFGGSEFALRLPTLLASTVSVALIFALGQRLYGETAGHVAAWAMALSPFAIQFSITIFVDPLLTTWLLAGMLLLARGRSGWAALAISLAWATKQTALLFVPVALLLGLVRLPSPARLRQAALYLLRAALPAVAGVALVTLLLIAWDQRRAAPIGIFQQGYSDNISTRLAGPWELKPRAAALLAMLRYFTGNDLISVLFLAGLVLMLVHDARHKSRAAWVDALFVIYQVGYLAGYWLVSLNLFDRYFLPILPLWALLVGRVFDVATQWLTLALDRLARRAGLERGRASRAARLAARVALPLTLLGILVPVTAAANYNFSPIGGDHGAYDGVDDAARFIHTLPRDSVLYDHWLNWEFDYYLFDKPVETLYYPDAQTLARDLALNGCKRPHYLAWPWWAQDLDPRPVVAQAGFALRPVHQSFRRDGVVSLTIYQVERAR
jgi:4-amino-4-deoxy-L-arabinose transferase-like glycosyltransferase